MSSYEVGGVDVGVSLMAGTIAIGAALAVLTPVAGGYVVYKTGKTIYDELAREHQEAVERQIREQARERARLENAKKIRNEIKEECKNKIAKLQSEDFMGDASLSFLAQNILEDLQNIKNEDEKLDVVGIELQNNRDIQRIKDLVEQLKTESTLIKNNKTENQNMISFIENMKTIFEGLSVDTYYDIHNIEIDDKEKASIKKHLARIEELKEKFYVIVEREKDRFGNYPIVSVNVNRIASLFEKISNEINSIDVMEKKSWILEEKIHSIEKSIEAYDTYRALLDKEQEKFLNLYLSYKQSCEEVGEECKEAVEFNSMEELEATVKERVKILERAKKCSEIYSKLGREAYICMAFEMELNKLNYTTSEKKNAEEILKEKLKNCHIGGKAVPFYEYKNEAMMQIFKVSDKVELQLIVHNDGTSTMETVSLKPDELKETVETQKKHCEKTKILEEALEKKWFITANFEEERSADNIAFEFEGKNENFENVIASAKAKAQNRRENARKQRRRNNQRKMQERSMALCY